MTKTASPPLAPAPDKAALVRVGKAVRRRLDADPGIYRFPFHDAELYSVADFLTPRECADLISTIDGVARPSSVFDQDYNLHGRTSYSGDFDGHSMFVRAIERRIADLMGLELNWGESIQGQRYLPGQEFRGHYDYFDTLAGYWKTVQPTGGQRSWTAMIFLNKVEEGGATEFPLLGTAVAPQRGTMLIWNNACPDGLPNTKTLHAGTRSSKGEIRDHQVVPDTAFV